jgi:hypothetical protein
LRDFVTDTLFALHARSIHDTLLRSGAGLHDMRNADSLEMRIGADLAADDDASGGTGPTPLAWLEPVAPFSRAVPQAVGPSRIAWFLDGTQRTLPGYHHSAIPVMASITSAAILRRRRADDLGVLPGMLALDRCWLAPLRSGNSAIDAFIRAVSEAEIRVVDPLDELDEAAYRACLHDYANTEQRALRRSRENRARLERALLASWSAREDADDTWIVVDGALRDPAPNAIGLVKSFTRQYVTGFQADELFRLPAGYRTAAFAVEDQWRAGNFTVWYLRMWDARGRDPRHALIRVEVAGDTLSPEMIDELSAWILAERRPRATADARWATLLYPIHYLEQILKRLTDAEIRHWPGSGAARA